MPVAPHAGNHRIDDFAHDLRAQRRIDQRARSEGAHPPGIRTLVAVEDALVVLRRSHRNGAAAVADREKRDLGAGQAFLEHEPIPGGPELPLLHRRGDRGAGCRPVVGDDDPLAGGEAVGLDHHGISELATVKHGLGRSCVVADAITGRRNAMSGHEVLGEDLAALESGSGGGRTKDLQPS